MTDTLKPEDKDYDAEDSRRSFLKRLGLAGAGAVVSTATGCKLPGAEKNPQTLEAMKAKTNKKIVKQGDTVWGFYDESGWNEESFDLYQDAVIELNPNIDIKNIQPGDEIIVPIK